MEERKGHLNRRKAFIRAIQAKLEKKETALNVLKKQDDQVKEDAETIFDYKTKVPEVSSLFSEKNVLDKIYEEEKNKNMVKLPNMSKTMQKEH